MGGKQIFTSFGWSPQHRNERYKRLNELESSFLKIAYDEASVQPKSPFSPKASTHVQVRAVFVIYFISHYGT